MGLISRFQAMHKSIRNTIRNIFAPIAAVAIATMATGCADDLYNGVGEPNAEGMYGPFSLTVPLGASVNEVKSRSTFDLSDIQINNAWVGIFDATDGHLVGGSSREFVNPSAPSTGHTDASIGDDYNMTFDNLYFNDMNRYAYIVGVVNYDKIKVHNEDSRLDGFADADGQISLKLALDSIRNLNDYLHLSVNTASAEAAVAEANAPLMSGVLSTGDANKQRHGNFTFSVSEKNEIEVQSNQYADAAKITLFDYDTKKVNPLPNGSFVHLRSLVNHIKVNVTVANGVTIENPTVEVYNIPKAVFVQERATVTDIPKDLKTAEAWAKISPAASDYVWGYTDSPYVLTPGGSRVIDAENAGFFQDETDVMSQTNNAITFGYWHFENKHWGNSGCSTYVDREKRFGTSNVYTSLCPDVDRNFNNGATYMVLKGKVTQADGLTANAQFIIHEGYCSQPNGNAATTEGDAARDFSTFRNTEYTYNVEINGINSMILNVSQDGEIANPGVMGDVWGKTVNEVKVSNDGNSYKVTLPAGKVYWCIQDGDGQPFGVPMDASWQHAEKYPGYPANVSTTIPASQFYDAITVNGKKLGEIGTLDADTPATVEFGNYEDMKSNLYLCGITTSSDGSVKYYALYLFKQGGLVLQTPVITMPFAPSTGPIMGIDDHTISWNTVDKATAYKITLLPADGCGGYTATVAPGATHTDSDGYQTTLVDNGDGTVSFRMRYANSQKALLSFLQSEKESAKVTFEVVAMNGEYESEPATFTTTIYNPIWDFSATSWQTEAAKVPLTSDGTFPEYYTITINGLTLSTGNSAKMKYYKSGNYYVFRPGGAGTKDRLNFKFHACCNGKLSFWTSDASKASSGRYVMVLLDDGNPPLQSPDAVTTAPGKLNKIGDVNNVDPVNKEGSNPNVTIYNSADLLYYKIQFTPQDR